MQEVADTVHLPVATDGKPPPSKFVTFRVDKELFGVNINDVREVTPVMEITPVFHAPDEVMGYVNIRGVIHLVISLRILLNLPPREETPESRIVIFKPKIAEPFGILVDCVGDVLEVDSDSIERNTSANASRSRKDLISGVCKLEENLLIVLNSGKILA